MRIPTIVSMGKKEPHLIIIILLIFLILGVLPYFGIAESCKDKGFLSHPFCVIVYFVKLGADDASKINTENNPNNNLKIQELNSKPETVNSQFNAMCSKIEEKNSLVRGTAVLIAKNSEGKWNVGQLVDLFVWMKSNIKYVSDPSTGNYYALASETLRLGAGNCQNQAILIASMIRSVGGTSKILVAPSCQHAFAAVYISNNKSLFDEICKSISQLYYDRYNLLFTGSYSYYKDENGGYWLIIDPAGGQYLGDLLQDCKPPFQILNC